MTKDKSPENTKDQTGDKNQIVYHRLIASKAYYSGELETLKKKAIESGAAPWKIIRYQRIVEPEKIPFPIAKTCYVRPNTFEHHLQYLNKHCKVISLVELIQAIQSKTAVADNSVVLTFDGGYLDNFVYAYPLLMKYQFPATIFLPTAFTGTSNYLFDDKVSFALTAFKRLGLKLPPFSFLDDEFRTKVVKETTTGEITATTMAILIQALHRATPEDRLVALHFFGNVLKDSVDLPQERCFMNWDEVRHLSQSGFRFGSMSHNFTFFNQLTAKQMAEDILASLKAFEDAKVKPIEVFCFPGGIMSSESYMLLQIIGARYALTLGSMPAPEQQPEPTRILGRVPMYEGASFCTEVFACRLWEAEISGIKF